MLRKPVVILVFFLMACIVMGQRSSRLSANAWVDSVFNTLSPDEKIAQLMMVRGSSFDPKTKRPMLFTDEVEQAVRKFNVGGICMFQGGPVAQANFINRMQSISRTPILIAIDAENGLGMRLDSVLPLPRQMMIGAVQDPAIVYQYGKLVGQQCRRIGIQVNFAPVVDINNNPLNPVINDRSFGENKYKVAEYGIAYMKGLQDVGVMATAKHFPGHGDVSVDSHLDLPVINKSRGELDSLELYPFRKIFDAGVGSVMIAHLYIPAIDKTENRATSLSYANVTKLLRRQMGFQGLSFTDALEMKGVTKYFPDGQASVESLIAGNDMLCLPGDIAITIEKVKSAIRERKLRWKDIDRHVKKILQAKYRYGLANLKPVNTTNLAEDLNNGLTQMTRTIAENALTVLRSNDRSIFPLMPGQFPRIAYIGIGLKNDNAFSNRLRNDFGAHTYFFDYTLNDEQAKAASDLIRNRYDVVITGLHNFARFPASNYGVSTSAMWLLKQLQQQNRTIIFTFGNPYIISGFCDANNLVACYEDDSITQETAADLLEGKIFAKGKLPVAPCGDFKAGQGIVNWNLLPVVQPSVVGLNESKLNVIDSIVNDGIRQKAYPGAVVLVAKDGRIVYERAFGQMAWSDPQPMTTQTIFDLASVTKICATNLAVMKLYDEGKLDLQKTLGDYLPWLRGSNKENIRLWDVILHQAGLKAYIPFYRETLDSLNGNIASSAFYKSKPDAKHSVRVAENLYLRNDWVDTMYQRIRESEVGPIGKYIYSDNDFILLGKIVEAVSGMPLNEYVSKTFYVPLGMTSTGFRPRERFPIERIAPTEEETYFRKQLIQGDVHDPGAAMFGGVAGHAGLFSDARDLAIITQLLLNKGMINGKRYFRPETVDYFTAYHSNISRRGLGFDKPEKDNYERKEPYPAASASPETYGHTGFTGIGWWVDPKRNIAYIFLSNRVNSPGSNYNKLGSLNIRGKVQEAIYASMENK